MSEWRGLHNPDRHDPDGEKLAFCYSLTGGCGEYCWPERPCRCCLAAEVERLTDVVRRVRSVLAVCDFEVDRASDGDLIDPPIAVVPVHNVLLALRGDA